MLNRIRFHYADIVLLAVFATLKVLFLQRTMNLTRHPVILALTSFAVLVALYSIAVLFKPGLRRVVLLVLHLLVTVLLIADLIYYRFFNTLLSLEAYQFARQARVVTNTVQRAIKVQDILMILDLPLVFLLQRDWEIKVPKHRMVPLAACLLVAAVVLSAATSVANANGEGWVLSYFGAINYHLYDIWGEPDISEEEFLAMVREELLPRYQQPNSTEGRELYGVAAGRNIIVIQLESFNNYVIGKAINGQEITPNLNRLLRHDTIYFDRYYQQVGRGRTSDAEFATHNSLFAIAGSTPYYKYPDNHYYSVPLALKDHGYQTAVVLHGYEPDFWNRREAYVNQGIDRFYSMPDFPAPEHQKAGWGILDVPFFEKSIEYLEQLPQPFYSMLITLTNHTPFELPEEYQLLDLPEELQESKFGDYLQCVRYTDEAVGLFIEKLKESGLYDNSIIAIYGDHYGIAISDKAAEDVEAFIGRSYDYDVVMNVPLMFHIPGLKRAETRHIVGGQVDFYPTLFNLLGLPVENQAVMGQDLFNAEAGFVVGTGALESGSFIDDKKMFIMSNDGIFDHSRAFDLETGHPIPIEKCREQAEQARRLRLISDYILKFDLIPEMPNILAELSEDSGS